MSLPVRRSAWLLLFLVTGACAPGGDDTPADDAAVAAAPDAGPEAPSAGDAEYARWTASWSDAALDGCGPSLRETLGTRDLVQGALDGVEDPAAKAGAELEDARHWLAQGNARLDEVQIQLETGVCDGTLQVALDEAVQFYIKAGTSAVQAGQIAGS